MNILKKLMQRLCGCGKHDDCEHVQSLTAQLRLGPADILESGALITGLTFLDPKDATRVQGFFQHLQVRFGDGPWQDVKGLDEVGSDTGRTGE